MKTSDAHPNVSELRNYVFDNSYKMLILNVDFSLFVVEDLLDTKRFLLEIVRYYSRKHRNPSNDLTVVMKTFHFDFPMLTTIDPMVTLTVKSNRLGSESMESSFDVRLSLLEKDSYLLSTSDVFEYYEMFLLMKHCQLKH